MILLRAQTLVSAVKHLYGYSICLACLGAYCSAGCVFCLYKFDFPAFAEKQHLRRFWVEFWVGHWVEFLSALRFCLGLWVHWVLHIYLPID